MARYTRRRLLGLWSNRQAATSTDQILTDQKHAESPNNQRRPESNRPLPPDIQPLLPQQSKPVAHANAPSSSNQLAITTNQPASVVSLPIIELPSVREIVFSFDDGPSTLVTAKILDILAKYQIRTIFFVLGRKIDTKAGRNLMVRAHQEGHLIANHTYSHPNLTQISAEGIRNELRRTEELIGEYAAPGKLMRPPYGALNQTVNQVLEEEGYTAVLWTLATLDWQYQNDEWVNFTIEKLQNGPRYNHVLMHDTYRWTANNLEDFIQQIQALPNTRIAPFYR